MIALSVVFPLFAVAADGIDMRDLKTIPSGPPIELPEAVTAQRLESFFGTTSSYKLAPGAYHSLGKDSEGVYYACASGIVAVTTLKDGTQLFNRLVGGIYLGQDEQSATKIWFVGAAAAATRGANKLSRDEASAILERCDDSKLYVGTANVNAVNISVLPVDTQSIGPAVVSGAIATLIVNSIVGANDGRLLTPAVRFEKPVLVTKPQ